METGKARRLPVIARSVTLAGIISMDDLLQKAEPTNVEAEPDLSSNEVV
jgi:hypothetical protein